MDNESPTFVNPPVDTLFDCLAAIPELQELAFEDNCLQGGFAFGTQEGIQDFQAGDTITRQWSVIDNAVMKQSTFKPSELDKKKL